MQIKGEDFVKKVQLQQEREELERKLNELEEVEMSINNEPVIIGRNNNTVEQNDNELDNIMLNSSVPNTNEDNKKKYLMLGIILVVLFLLTIIIIRLLTDDTTKEDQFTSNNANSSEIQKLSENTNIEENFQKIINERVKKDSVTPTVTESDTVEQRLESIKQTVQNNESPEEPQASITNEALDETIKRIEEKKAIEQEIEEKKEVVKIVEPRVEKTVEKKSVKDLMENQSNDISKGYFVQVGAFTRKPSDSYINSIRNAKLKYKIYQVEIKGTLYNKVLIGPYSSRAAANEEIEDIKKKLNISSAYVLKF